MKKAVIKSGSKQYLVSPGDTIEIDLQKTDSKTLQFVPLLIIDGDTTTVGNPEINAVKVSGEVVENDLKAPKVTSIRYKAKKRVHTVRGHRQRRATVKITKIS